MTVQFKFFQIVDEKAIGDIAAVRAGRQARQDAIVALVAEFGADHAREYNDGGLAYFSFPQGHTIDRKVWKKSHDGFLPKVRTAEFERLRALPAVVDFDGVIDRWGLGNEMVIGPSTGRGFPMHSSHLQGDFEKKFFYVKVPYTGEYDKPTPDGLKEIKEWEALKGMDE